MMKTILVQMSDRKWTMEALHQACSLARQHHAQVILLHIIPVTHASYLGTSYGRTNPVGREIDDLYEYEATFEDYGVDALLQPMQAVTTVEAIAAAAELLGADLVFAHLPFHRFPLWHRHQIRALKARLQACGSTLATPKSDRSLMLYTLEDGTASRTPCLSSLGGHRGF
ncbi:MAG: hypothetical protein IPK19_34675 [Chloroflexi bacterium]|nr:hypothetical protein [Chloroflexota bacterium]